MIPSAHAGHWLTELLYVAPVAALVVYFGIQALRDRRDPERHARREAEDLVEPTLDDILEGRP